ncbi:hypothetical protein [Hoeflea ulvae]|uniref:DUF4325 domain-containing protein n=1 Tax=Hoeflea ulvae TaxID=2983764 RepID=A0ABT3YFE3_9HYPH|nr:hypothetical protein [Hoeflea ulvae]MCY0094594.1 hypothetical protein [Hoeflea ulvae]
MVLEATRIDFREIAGGTVRNISGHERGVEARKKYDLDRLDAKGEVVSVIIPDDIDAVAASFFQGMFSESVKRFKSKDEFLRHYNFIAKPVMMEQILRGIDRSLTERRGSAFKT